jgi:hypothetical protein|tara:strand:+ start:523 stop:894 length:372 start_codon:yes stop_codon:yes gene_type:complete
MVKYINVQLVLMCFVVLIVGCNYQMVPVTPVVIEKSKFAGDYPTVKLREMWAVCHQTISGKAPLANGFQVGVMCDCYLDEMRKVYTLEDLDTLTGNEAKKMGQGLIGICNQGQAINFMNKGAL